METVGNVLYFGPKSWKLKFDNNGLKWYDVDMRGGDDMETTTRVHSNNSVARDHNRREPGLVEHTPHIDPDGIHEIWGPDRTVADAYAEIFGDALDAYNARQKRSDRRMTVEQYMESVESDTRGRQPRKRVKGKLVPDDDAKKGKKLSYELVISVGNTNKLPDEEGIAAYDEEGTHEVHPQEVPYEVNREACRRFVEGFDGRNPHLRIVRCDWHADEFYYNALGYKEQSTAHAHLEYVPVADGYKTGPERQAALGKALLQQGFDGYPAWQAAEREAFEAIVQDVYAEYCATHPDYAAEHGDLTIVRPYHGRHAENKPTEEYRQLQDLQQDIAEAVQSQECVLDGMRSAERRRRQAVREEREAQERAEEIQEGAEAAQRSAETLLASAEAQAARTLKTAQMAAEREREAILAGARKEAERIKATAQPVTPRERQLLDIAKGLTLTVRDRDGRPQKVSMYDQLEREAKARGIRAPEPTRQQTRQQTYGG